MKTLKSRLIKRIKSEGPMSISSFMAAALFDPVDGFYPTRDPLGVDGDFITAPEISQIFGELIGLWCVQSWRDLGRPDPVHLIELGPGRGVMMSDIWRSAQLDPEFIKALHITLIEASPALQAVQAQTLAHVSAPVVWEESLEIASHGSAIIIGNEFIDCLPIRQFVHQNKGWHERVVTLAPKDKDEAADDTLIFALSPHPVSAIDLNDIKARLKDNPTPKEGDLLEICPGATQICETLAQRFNQTVGRALFIDYGPANTEFGDTLQAIKAHEKVDPLFELGEADLTARVDFQAILEAATLRDLTGFGPLSQALFLESLGLKLRTERLKQLNPDAAATLERQLHRLTHPQEMGDLFKAICLQSAGLPYPAGFSSPYSS